MIARVVPALKLPAPMQYFDYSIPPEQHVAPGDFVRVPFRGQPVLGVVFELRERPESTRFELKSIVDALPCLRFLPAHLDILRESSRTLHANLPFLLHSFIPELPKRSAVSKKQPMASLAKKQKAVTEVMIYHSPEQHLRICRATIKGVRGQTLIIAPEIADVTWLATGLKSTKKRIVTLTSATPTVPAFAAFASFARGEAEVLIGTRLAALVPAPRLAQLIIDRDEDRSHAQDEMHPRYDARDILDARAAREMVPLTIFSETPRVERSLVATDDKHTSPPATVVSLRNHWRSGFKGFFTEELLEAVRSALANKRQSILFLNRKGLARLLVCSDCKRVVLQQTIRAGDPVPLFCPTCQSPDLKFKQLGITSLAAEIQKMFPESSVATLERKREGERPPPYPEAPIVITTESFMHWFRTRAYTAPIGLVAALYADPLWHQPDWRANEQALATLVSFQNLAAATNAAFMVQTGDPDARVIRALAGNTAAFYTEELEDRKALHYPPYGTPHRETSS